MKKKSWYQSQLDRVRNEFKSTFKMDKVRCLHCGELLELSGSTWLHQNRNRWDYDNGFYCYKNNLNLSANPRSKEENEFRKNNYICWSENGVWMVKNAKTGEIQVDPYHNKK